MCKPISVLLCSFHLCTVFITNYIPPCFMIFLAPLWHQWKRGSFNVHFQFFSRFQLSTGIIYICLLRILPLSSCFILCLLSDLFHIAYSSAHSTLSLYLLPFILILCSYHTHTSSFHAQYSMPSSYCNTGFHLFVVCIAFIFTTLCPIFIALSDMAYISTISNIPS